MKETQRYRCVNYPRCRRWIVVDVNRAVPPEYCHPCFMKARHVTISGQGHSR